MTTTLTKEDRPHTEPIKKPEGYKHRPYGWGGDDYRLVDHGEWVQWIDNRWVIVEYEYGWE